MQVQLSSNPKLDAKSGSNGEARALTFDPNVSLATAKIPWAIISLSQGLVEAICMVIPTVWIGLTLTPTRYSYRTSRGGIHMLFQQKAKEGKAESLVAES